MVRRRALAHRLEPWTTRPSFETRAKMRAPQDEAPAFGPTIRPVMPGLAPGIHVLAARKTWMAGTDPAMTNIGFDDDASR
jgi:hypothetical protein